jgi:hypothetical protein
MSLMCGVMRSKYLKGLKYRCIVLDCKLITYFVFFVLHVFGKSKSFNVEYVKNIIQQLTV